MALDKNDGTFSPSIEGVISGKTSQVSGMNELLNNLIGNDNYLKDKKLDRGNYTGTAEKLHTDSDAIWGGLDGGGKIEDPTVVKEVGKRYIGADGKAYICLVPSNINNSTNYTPCNSVDNLNRINSLNFYGGKTLAETSDLRVGVKITHPTFNQKTVEGKNYKISAPSSGLTMEAMAAPGFRRVFMLHGTTALQLIISLDETGYTLYGSTSGITALGIVEVIIK